MARLFEVHAHSVQRLRLAKCCPAFQTAITLDDAIDVFEFSEFLRFTVATSAIHLTLSGQVLQWECIFADTTEGFGLWLRPASVTSTDRAFVYDFALRVFLAPGLFHRAMTAARACSLVRALALPVPAFPPRRPSICAARFNFSFTG